MVSALKKENLDIFAKELSYLSWDTVLEIIEDFSLNLCLFYKKLCQFYSLFMIKRDPYKLSDIRRINHESHG